MPHARLFATLFCGLLVAAELCYLLLANRDGELDQTKLPSWMGGDNIVVETVDTENIESESSKIHGPMTGASLRASTNMNMTGGDTLSRSTTLVLDPAINVDSRGSRPHGVNTNGKSNLHSTSSADQQLDEVALTRLLQGAAVRIVHTDESVVGSGVIINIADSWFDVLTASHVVKNSSGMSVRSFSPENDSLNQDFHAHRSVEMLFVDHQLDLAIIRVFSPLLPVVSVEIGSFNQSIPQFAWTVDNTTGEMPMVRQQEVLRQTRAKRTSDATPVDYFVTSDPSIPGMSGSGLFDRDGRLLGIASGNAKSHAYFVDIRAVTSIVERLSASHRLQR